MSMLKDIRKDTAAMKKLDRIAADKGGSLTADEARRILRHLQWLTKEREVLFDSVCDD
jgi:hypothetical protein